MSDCIKCKPWQCHISFLPHALVCEGHRDYVTLVCADQIDIMEHQKYELAKGVFCQKSLFKYIDPLEVRGPHEHTLVYIMAQTSSGMASYVFSLYTMK